MSCPEEKKSKMHLLDLPCSVLMQIFENLSYEEVSKMRLVCQHIDQVCQSVLNSGFSKVIRQHSIASKRIKMMLPRRESERRNHYLARHADILTSVETRISMLTMTYTKYMDLGMCCFIPGRVLDEIFRILRLISVRGSCLRPHEVLQELRDISSMAIEHFEEKIAGTFKKQIEENSVKARAAAVAAVVNAAGSTGSTSPSCSLDVGSPTFSADRDVNVQIVANKQYLCRLVNLGQPSMNYLVVGSGNNAVPVNIADISASGSNVNSALTDASNDDSKRCGLECSAQNKTVKILKKELLKLKKRLKNQQTLFRVQQRSQTRRTQRMMNAISSLSASVADLKKRVDENDAKNRELVETIRQLNNGEETMTPQSSGEKAEVTNAGNATVAAASNTMSTCVDNAVMSKNKYTTSSMSKNDCEIVLKNCLPSGRNQPSELVGNEDSSRSAGCGTQVVNKRQRTMASAKSSQDSTTKRFKKK